MQHSEKSKTAGLRTQIMRLVKWIFIVAVVIFIVRYFVKNIDDIKDMEIAIDWLVFLPSMLLFFAYKIMLVSLWHLITKRMGCAISYEKAVISYLYSILGKYIPGKVFMLGARLAFYSTEKANLRKVTICFFIENICTLLGSALLFLLSLFFFPNEILQDYQFITVGLIVALIICINPRIINFFLRILQRLIKKDDLVITMTYPQMIQLVFLFAVNWLCVGAGFYMLVYSFCPIPLGQGLYVAGIFALSAIIGILSLFAPSGIGVREGVMVMGLSVIMQEEMAVIVSIVSRLWCTIPELISVMAAFVYGKARGIRFNRKDVRVIEAEIQQIGDDIHE